MAQKRLIFVITEDWYFCSHRLSLARAARDAGFHVGIACRVGELAEKITAEGFALHPLRLRREGRSPLGELAAIAELFRLYRREKPDIVHHVAMKPVLYGSLAALLARVPAIINAVAGMGFVFTSTSAKARLLRPALSAAFRLLLNRKNARLVVQNPDDRAAFARFVDGSRLVVIPGSGVDTQHFAPSPEPNGAIAATLVARMLWDKGIGEFVEAARILRRQGLPVTMRLIGRPDPMNPASASEAELRGWVKEGIVEWQGHRADIEQVWRDSHIAVLPSYREGLPRALLEAAASGRPMVATDVPGCRDVVRDGKTGLLVPARNAEKLADAIATLAQNAPLRAKLGEAARQMVLAEMGDDVINDRFLTLYRQLAP